MDDGRNQISTSTTVGSLKIRPNSYKYRAEKSATDEPEKKSQKHVLSAPVRVKASPWKRFTRALFVDDADTIKEYVAKDVIMPTIRNLIFDSLSGMLEMALYGVVRGRRSNNSQRGGNERVSYSAYYKSGGDNRRRDDSSDRSSKVDYRDFAFETRTDAETVLGDLYDLVQEYGKASIGDLCDLIGVTSDFSEQKWGWTNLNRADVRHTRDGYYLNLPKPQALT